MTAEKEEKHTPGPWRYEADDIMGGPPSRPIKIAQTVDGNGEAYSKREVVDAFLIAAAPELLTALVELVNCGALNRTREKWERARTAIAKAEGR